MTENATNINISTKDAPNNADLANSKKLPFQVNPVTTKTLSTKDPQKETRRESVAEDERVHSLFPGGLSKVPQKENLLMYDWDHTKGKEHQIRDPIRKPLATPVDDLYLETIPSKSAGIAWEHLASNKKKPNIEDFNDSENPALTKPKKVNAHSATVLEVIKQDDMLPPKVRPTLENAHVNDQIRPVDLRPVLRNASVPNVKLRSCSLTKIQNKRPESLEAPRQSVRASNSNVPKPLKLSSSVHASNSNVPKPPSTVDPPNSNLPKPLKPSSTVNVSNSNLPRPLKPSSSVYFSNSNVPKPLKPASNSNASKPLRKPSSSSSVDGRVWCTEPRKLTRVREACEPALGQQICSCCRHANLKVLPAKNQRTLPWAPCSQIPRKLLACTDCGAAFREKVGIQTPGQDVKRLEFCGYATNEGEVTLCYLDLRLTRCDIENTKRPKKVKCACPKCRLRREKGNHFRNCDCSLCVKRLIECLNKEYYAWNCRNCSKAVKDLCVNC